jgi:hypothetical protein
MNYTFSKMSAIALFVMLSAPLVSASTNSPYVSPDSIGAFRKYSDIKSVGIKTPTVVAVPFDGVFLERPVFEVKNMTTGESEPYLFVNDSSIDAPRFVVTDESGTSARSGSASVDNNIQTYSEFDVPSTGEGIGSLTIMSDRPVDASGITFLLPENVALPTSIQIKAVFMSDGTPEKIVVASRAMTENTIRFPRTTALNWNIHFTYAQPLRIAEIHILDDAPLRTASQSVRFLSQPGNTYRIYFDPDRTVSSHYGEAGNLGDDSDVLAVERFPAIMNTEYVIADVDSDTVPDLIDNCVSVANPFQEDINGNMRGDICEDFDKDGIPNEKDNCPNEPNRAQADEDGDGVGDVCDLEENRFTERHTWVPWAGMGLAGLVLLTLFAITASGALTKKG